ncbi:MAG: hypothetical protein CL862_01445 [Cyanobium sp. NAT70]|nr:hypothetical protein [Cyanobium sp. NAT70]
MIRPRWQGFRRSGRDRAWRRWDQGIAILAAINLTWVIFDVTYVPLRKFWLQRNLYPLPSLPLVVPLPWLPDITPYYDPIKGIEPHRDTQAYLNHFEQLDQAMLSQGLASPTVKQLLEQQLTLTERMIQSNPFLSSSNSGALEKLKTRFRARADLDSSTQAAGLLLSAPYLSEQPWHKERLFWKDQILPLVAINTWRSSDENGQPTDLSWRVDTPFQLLFLLDILLRALRVKRRYPAIRWRDALLRRWIDLPLLLPFARLLRVVPVTERLSNAGLIQLEPLRAAISRGVVALLAVELFEVITIRVVDALQQMIRSPQLPQRIRGFCTYQGTELNEQRELVELVRLWLPLLLSQVGPNMKPQLVALLGHLLQQNLNKSMIPEPLRGLPTIVRAESELSRQLAENLVDSVLGLSRGASSRLERRDTVLEALSSDTIDRFWEELARALEQGPVLERSQELLASLLEDLKRSSFRQIRDQGGVDDLIRELDGLNFSSSEIPPRSQA